ncbi:AAA family ATPase [Hirschia litorea]|uniref:AAA family ATPase n=1 Tax=Hirschia litorea TaxID=1199156 RepID=A0ABW2IJF7_9PROT
MTGPNDTLDDETYESLIEELGLDLDIDEPIGELETETSASETASFDAAENGFGGDASEAAGEQNDSGVEISADLLAELQSVIGGSASQAADFDEDATFTEDPLNVDGEIDLADALMGKEPDLGQHVQEEQAPVELSTSEELDDEDDEFTSIFDDLDLTEADLVQTNDATVQEDEYTAPLSEADEDEEWASNTPSGEYVGGADNVDDILANALSKEFEPPVDNGDFSDRFAASAMDEEHVEEKALKPSRSELFESPHKKAERQFKPEYEPVEDELDFDLDDFADDAELTTHQAEPAAPVSRKAEAKAPLLPIADPEEYVAATASVELHDDDEADFGMSPIEGGDRVIPRINIHAFCQTQLCQQMLNKSMQDRRMINVTANIQDGGVPAAINFYQENEMPHMIIVESVSASGRLLAELDELAQLCDEGVKVVVIGAANDIRLYRELMRRGVSEYIVPPLETVQLIRAISSQFADPEQPFVGKTLAVTGVKGGVGSSTIAHNLAWTLAERLQLGTTLVDLDLNFGTTGLDFNNESNQTIADALLAPERFDEAVMSRLITQATDNLSLFTAPASLDRTYDMDEETYSTVLDKVRSSVPYVVLDLPHIWTDWFKGTVVSADEIVVVAQPDLASLRNGKNLVDFLKAARPNDSKPRLVINQVGVPKRPEIPVKDFAQAIDLEPDLVLPFDPQLFGTAANNGQMIADIAEDSKCSQGIDYLASLLSGREIKTERSSLLNKLFKR